MHVGVCQVGAREGRRLHGRRGLKCRADAVHGMAASSPPSRAAWIEILPFYQLICRRLVAAFTGGVD